jgi:P-type conjugative transfer protein TrbG
MLRQITIFAFLACAPVMAVAGPGQIAGPDGVLRYPFGERTPPTLRCKPLFVCDLVLGDSVRWLIAPASSGGSNGATPHVLVKPTEAGLRTNLIVTTNRRTYYLTLVSSYNNPMLRIGFLYPQDPQLAFASAALGRGVRADAPLPDAAIDKLDFNYRVRGDRELQPVHVFNDGTHTYLQMPEGMHEVPVLFAVGTDGSDTLVNYRFTGQYYVVDGVPAGIALVEGSGKHQRRALVTRGS